MSKLTILIFLALIGSITSCISIPFENVDPTRNNREMFRKDLNECKEDYPESGSGLHYRQWSDCMRLKGWR